MRTLLAILFALLLSSPAAAATTITAQVVRNEAGTGTCQISNGFPFPSGLVTESIITSGLIKVTVDGTEVAANVSALRGRHADGTIRAALIQFTYSMAEDDVVAAQVIVGTARSSPDPDYVMPTFAMVQNNNVILPTDSSYITTTNFTLRNLIAEGAGGVEEEKLYTTLLEDRAAALDPAGDVGTARYEAQSAILSAWARTGDAGYWNNFVVQMQGSLAALIPYNDGCSSLVWETINPDNITGGGSCGQPSEAGLPNVLSVANAYLMTGYKAYWATVAYHLQIELKGLTDRTTTIAQTIPVPGDGGGFDDHYDTPRWNYAKRMQSLIAAYAIDATYPARAYDAAGQVLVFADRLDWVLDAIEDAEWDLKWIPFDSGSGTVPNYGTTITQGGISATLLGVYQAGKHDPRVQDGVTTPSAGHLQVKGITGGSFSAGALSGITASATGAEESDYRQGSTGTRSYNQRSPNINAGYCSISGTTMTVSSVTSAGIVGIGQNISGSGITGGTYIVSQTSGTANGVGEYEVSVSQTVGSVYTLFGTVIPIFQLTFINNFLIDYYLYVYADSRIPAWVKANTDVILENTHLMVDGVDYYYMQGNETWGYATYGQPYSLDNPVDPEGYAPQNLPEYARSIAFTLKTSGEATVNGASYATWYERIIDTANISPVGVLIWSWKNFGQFYGWGQDAPWIMAQTTLGGASTLREPTYYAAIPGATPDLGRLAYQNISKGASLGAGVSFTK